MSAAAGAAAAQAAAVTQAIRAAGVLVALEPLEFLRLLENRPDALVVRAPGRLFFRSFHQYLTTYKGLAFHTKSPEPLSLPPNLEVIDAKSMWVPG